MKNIILLITDTYRYDNLIDRGDKTVRTPYLHEFMRSRATSLTKCYTGSFPTIPHRTDLATGILGWPHYGWQPIDQSNPNHIGKLLHKNGYISQLICDCPHLFNARFDQGFEAAFHNRGQEGDKALLHMNDPIKSILSDDKTRPHPSFRGASLPNVHRWTNRYMRLESETFAYRTSALAVKWLEENCNAGPFFLWVDFFDPHEPWDAPEYLVKKYDPDYTGTPMIHPNYGLAADYTDEELRNLWAHYAAEAQLVDRQLGRIIEKIDDLDLWDDTIVVVTTDHGMSLGDHARTGKSNISDRDGRFWPIYPEIGHIPFLVAGGNVPEGRTLDIIFQPADILPTLSALAGAAMEPPQGFDGQSAADSILSGAQDWHRQIAVSGSHVSQAGDDAGIPPRATTPFLVNDRWGYAPVGADGSPELYDITDDPEATEDIAADNRETVRELHEMFIEHLRSHGADDESLTMWKYPGSGKGKWAIDYE